MGPNHVSPGTTYVAAIVILVSIFFQVAYGLMAGIGVFVAGTLAFMFFTRDK